MIDQFTYNLTALVYSFMAILLVLALATAASAQNPASPSVQVILSATTNRQPAKALDTIHYKAEIINVGDTAAFNMMINRSGDPNTTLIPGTFKSTPVALPATFVNLLEDQSLSLMLAGIDPDDDALNFSIIQPAQQGILGEIASVSNTEASVNYQPNLHFSGADQFSFSVTDADGNPDTSVVMLEILPVNDAPFFLKGTDIVINNNSEVQTFTNWATEIKTGPADEQMQTLTFMIEENDNPSLFAEAPQIAADGTLTFKPATDAVGVANISIRLKDDGGTENGGIDLSDIQTFSITLEM